MPIACDNPLGHDIIVTRRCNECQEQDTRALWSRPWEFAGKAFAERRVEVPLSMRDVAGMLRDAPYRCAGCGGDRATLVGVALDESTIWF